MLRLELGGRVQRVSHPRLHRDLHLWLEPGAPRARDASLLHHDDVVRVLAAGHHRDGGLLHGADHIGPLQLAVGEP